MASAIDVDNVKRCLHEDPRISIVRLLHLPTCYSLEVSLSSTSSYDEDHDQYYLLYVHLDISAQEVGSAYGNKSLKVSYVILICTQ